MSTIDVVARFDSVSRSVVRLLQLSLVAMAGYGIVVGSFGLTINAGMALAISALPVALERRYSYEMNGILAVWIAAAAFLHGVGALGPYETVPWYDQVTHTLSATLVAGGGYAVVSAIDRHDDRITIPPKLRFAFILLFVLAFGVLWEIAEFASGGLANLVGGEAVLAQYGVDDIVMDLLFNTVGATVVAAWGTGYFDGLSRFVTRRIGATNRE
jgi:hypothetical protein